MKLCLFLKNNSGLVSISIFYLFHSQHNLYKSAIPEKGQLGLNADNYQRQYIIFGVILTKTKKKALTLQRF